MLFVWLPRNGKKEKKIKREKNENLNIEGLFGLEMRNAFSFLKQKNGNEA